MTALQRRLDVVTDLDGAESGVGDLPQRTKVLGRSVTYAVIALLVAGCATAPGQPANATPAPAWHLTAGGVTYTSEAFVGGDITVKIPVSNDGSAANPLTKLQFGDMDKNADLQGCTPTCTVSSGFGGVYATEVGIGAGETVEYDVVWVAKAVGVAHWSVCIYDAEAGEQVYCGTGTTTIR